MYGGRVRQKPLRPLFSDIEADGKTYVIPTVIDGKLYTEEAAVKKFFNKEVEPIKVLKENISKFVDFKPSLVIP